MCTINDELVWDYRNFTSQLREAMKSLKQFRVQPKTVDAMKMLKICHVKSLSLGDEHLNEEVDPLILARKKWLLRRPVPSSPQNGMIPKRVPKTLMIETVVLRTKCATKYND